MQMNIVPVVNDILDHSDAFDDAARASWGVKGITAHGEGEGRREKGGGGRVLMFSVGLSCFFFFVAAARLSSMVQKAS